MNLLRSEGRSHETSDRVRVGTLLLGRVRWEAAEGLCSGARLAADVAQLALPRVRIPGASAGD